MRFISLLLFFIFLLSDMTAQQDTVWTRTYGGSTDEIGWSVQQTADGGFIIVGYTDSFGSGGSDIWLIKTDNAGDTLWTKTFGGAEMEMGFSVQQTTDYGFIIVGYTNSFGSGGSDIWLIKTDNLGDVLWMNTFGGNQADMGLSVQQTQDGGYVITGSMNMLDDEEGWHRDIILLKTNSNGDSLWARTYGGNEPCSEQGHSVRQTTDGGYIITGWTNSFGAGESDVWLIKTDAIGDTLWTRTFGGTEYDNSDCVKQTTDGGYIISGLTVFPGSDDYDMKLIKTDSIGNEEWNQTYGGVEYESAYHVAQANDGGYILAGYTSSYGNGKEDIWIVKTDHTGNEEWNQTYGGSDSDIGISLQPTDDDGYIIVGVTGMNDEGGGDIWLLRLGPESNTVNISTLPTDYILYNNYPNPFNPITTIQYELPQRSDVQITIYDLMGREVTSLVSERQDAGYKSVLWDASNVSSGMYFYQIKAGEFVQTEKMLLLK